MSSPVVPAAVFRRLLRAKAQMDDAYATTLTVDELARTAALSTAHFVRQFRAVFGVTPHQYLTQVRLARAKVLLARPHASVTQTCLDVGFQSLGSFSSLFARSVGRSPLSWHREVAPLFQVPQGLARVHVPYCFFRGLAGG